MSVEDKRLAALRKHHAQRPVVTRSKLMEALDRIESGNTVVLESDGKLTKTNLCREAGVNIHTLLVKDGKTGKRRYADVLKRFEALVTAKRRSGKAGDDKDEKIAELRAALRIANEDKVKMAREIDNIGMALLSEREEVKRLSSLDEQNAELREEVRLLKLSTNLRLVGKGKKGNKK